MHSRCRRDYGETLRRLLRRGEALTLSRRDLSVYERQPKTLTTTKQRGAYIRRHPLIVAVHATEPYDSTSPWFGRWGAVSPSARGYELYFYCGCQPVRACPQRSTASGQRYQ